MFGTLFTSIPTVPLGPEPAELTSGSIPVYFVFNQIFLPAAGSLTAADDGTGGGAPSGGAKAGATATGSGGDAGASTAPGADGGGATDPATPPAPASDAGKGPTSGSCTGLPLCDDFESVAAGGPPSAATWTIATPSCSGTGALAVDGTVAHSAHYGMADIEAGRPVAEDTLWRIYSMTKPVVSVAALSVNVPLA